ncbi:LytR/AlgR family response regulator transcription factor [Runella zeae]|uniref:LytR/AlgR family response regulator transcription factor n=1 Tax=Runella zeae TaxID=94255 RepID=UPI0006858284|nr:LytTR family DNA-binding domain-containing protein [Runella zeae]
MKTLILIETSNGVVGIRLPMNSYKVFVPLQEIVRLEGERNYTWVVLKNGKRILISKTLKLFENVLPTPFLRVSRGCMINLLYVVPCKNRIFKLTDGFKVPVSRRRVKVLEALREAA